MTLEDVGNHNLAKLQQRKATGTLHKRDSDNTRIAFES